MFRHSRPHPHVHVVRWHAFRAVRRITVGAALILAGVATLLRSQGLITQDELWLILPGAVALSGIVRVVACPSVGSTIGALVRLAIAAYLVVIIEHIGGWTLAATWPVLLIAVGVGTVLHGVLGQRWHEEPNW
jgi:hypothetical protein